MSERVLPEGWIETTLGEISTKPQYGYTTKASNHGTVKFLRTTDITKGELSWDSVPFCHEAPDDIDKFRLCCGDIVVSRAGSIGFSYLVDGVPEDAVFASYLIRLRPLGDMDFGFVKYYLQSPFYWGQLKSKAAGNALQNVNARKLAAIIVNVPPQAEQAAIADHLDKLLAQVNNLKARLEAIPELLKRFRQSVLAAAVSGRLTEDWRMALNFNRWEFFPLSEFSIDIQIGPFGSLLHKSDYVEGGVPLVNPMHISGGAITPTVKMTVAGEKAEELKRYSLEKGDVVLGRRGEMGRSAVVCSDVKMLCGTGSLFLRPQGEEVLSSFLSIYLRSPQAVDGLGAGSVGSTMINLNQKTLKNIPYPNVGVEEQAEIVRRVDQLFAFADQVEKQVGAAQARVDKLTQSILAKAFRGELTADWRAANPELISGEHSAEALLARIKAEKEKLKPAKSRRRSTTTAKGES